jgi:hypothetical protein
MAFTLKSHGVAAAKIASLTPLVCNGAPLSPTAGLTLVLEDGRRVNWLAESGAMPSPGDWLVEDSALAITFVLTPAKFTALIRG